MLKQPTAKTNSSLAMKTCHWEALANLSLSPLAEILNQRWACVVKCCFNCCALVIKGNTKVDSVQNNALEHLWPKRHYSAKEGCTLAETEQCRGARAHAQGQQGQAICGCRPDSSPVQPQHALAVDVLVNKQVRHLITSKIVNKQI